MSGRRPEQRSQRGLSQVWEQGVRLGWDLWLASLQVLEHAWQEQRAWEPQGLRAWRVAALAQLLAQRGGRRGALVSPT